MYQDMDMQNLDTSLFSISHPTPAPRCGDLLVAEPFLREEYFNHAVITLIEYHPGTPAMGLVLNKPTGYTIGEAIEGIDDNVRLPIFCGGPLSCDRLFYIHSLPHEFKGSRKVAPGIYVGGDFDQVKAYVNMGLDTDCKIRFFVGYSGWDPRQLEEEINNHVWAVTPPQTRKRYYRTRTILSGTERSDQWENLTATGCIIRPIRSSTEEFAIYHRIGRLSSDTEPPRQGGGLIITGSAE